MHLSDIFVATLTYVRLFLDAPQGDETVFRMQVESHLSQARMAAMDAGFEREDIDAAVFAVVAWIDEAVLCSSWDRAGAWSRRPLQKTYFNTTRAGVEFFTRLDAVASNNAAVREVFFLCLALGFKGRFAADGGRMALEEIKAREFKALMGKEGEALSKLFPDGYGDITMAPAKRRWQPSKTELLIFGGPLCFLLFLYLVFYFVLQSQVNDFLRMIQ
ncbi:MAG: DotU family type IV/VI secretion system protein [Moraxellaceae bacterium]|nr:DotU family type IV/VI secretion system protein [Moraxellaceae bacterium]